MPVGYQGPDTTIRGGLLFIDHVPVTEVTVVPCTHDEARDVIASVYADIAAPSLRDAMLAAWDNAYATGSSYGGMVTVAGDDGCSYSVMWADYVTIPVVMGRKPSKSVPRLPAIPRPDHTPGPDKCRCGKTHPGNGHTERLNVRR